MSEPMSAEQLAAIRRRSAADDVVHDGRRFLAAVHLDRRALVAEVERLRAELDVALGPSLYFDVQEVLDVALGTGLVDGAGLGIVGDVALLAEQKQAAEAERDGLRAELDSIRARAVARNDQLLAARDRCSYDDRVRRRAYEQAAAELRSLVDGLVGE